MSEIDRLRRLVGFLEGKLKRMREQGRDKGGWWTRYTREHATALERLRREERKAYVPRDWNERRD